MHVRIGCWCKLLWWEFDWEIDSQIGSTFFQMNCAEQSGLFLATGPHNVSVVPFCRVNKRICFAIGTNIDFDAGASNDIHNATFGGECKAEKHKVFERESVCPHATGTIHVGPFGKCKGLRFDNAITIPAEFDAHLKATFLLMAKECPLVQ